MAAKLFDTGLSGKVESVTEALSAWEGVLDEFPMTASVVPHSINQDSSNFDVVLGGDMRR